MLSRCRAFKWIRLQSQLPYLQRKSVDSFTSEEEFQDAVDIATLRKTKPELYHFEQVVPYGARIYPNDKFKFLENPVLWKGHPQYYKAAIKERRIEADKFHPDDWDLDHDHRMTWWGMTYMENKRWGSKYEWKINPKDVDESINIGFSLPKYSLEKKVKLSKSETVARKKQVLSGSLTIDEQLVHSEFMRGLCGTQLIGVIGAADQAQKHYNIHTDQFCIGSFYSVTPFDVSWKGEHGLARSFWGNELYAREMALKPEFKIKSGNTNLWTITITSLDSNLENNSELLHYGISNVTSDSISSGLEWCSYLPPIPIKGTGYHRLVITLYHQKNKMDVSNTKETLKDRSFSSQKYLQQFQENLTPAAFRFSQVQWDESVTAIFHEVLQMPQPVFEYDGEEEYPLERPEGLPSGVEHAVVKSWYPKEPKYPSRTKAQNIKPKLKQINYLYDANDHYGALDNK